MRATAFQTGGDTIYFIHTNLRVMPALFSQNVKNQLKRNQRRPGRNWWVESEINPGCSPSMDESRSVSKVS